MKKKNKELYFNWLCDLVGIESRPGHAFFFLARDLFAIEFKWIVPDDANRANDAKTLRYDFCEEYSHSAMTDEDIDAPPTVLEVLIGLSQRMVFSYCGDGRNCEERWFFEMVQNMGCCVADDDVYEKNSGSFITEKAVDDWMNRRYEPSGLGGVFPLKKPMLDQREEELWRQMNSYLIEKGME